MASQFGGRRHRRHSRNPDDTCRRGCRVTPSCPYCMTLDDPYRHVRRAIVNLAGGYLRNTAWASAYTCSGCSARIDQTYSRCVACNKSSDWDGKKADSVGIITYAWPQHQSGYLMYGYKAASPQPQHRTIVQLLL